MFISCITPTRNRSFFLAQAIKYFSSQTYPHKELIIIDDSDEPVDDFLVRDSRIKYRHINNKLSVGEKRNLACELASGDYICHWDDDDWMSPHRLETQLVLLRKSRADVCGLSALYYYEPRRARAWYYQYPGDQRPWVAGGTFLYKKDAWERNKFADIDVGEDTRFLWSLSDINIAEVDDGSVYVGIIHDSNVSAKSFSDRKWQPCDINDVAQLIGNDRDFYSHLRSGELSASCIPNREKDARVTLAAHFIVYDGYGSMAEHLAVGLRDEGVDINVIPLSIDTEGLSRDFLSIYRRSSPRQSNTVLYFCWPNEYFPRFQSTANLFVYTMWEASELPAGWARLLNQCKAVLVPTRFVARVCKDSGVAAPVHVVPQGVDPSIYYYIERPERGTLTCLIVGTVVRRKHVLEAIAGWQKAFPDQSDVRLIIKSRFQYGNYQPDDPRITLVDDNETSRGILHWYERADVLLALGNEGFGLPLVEAMATGLPVIALNSEGQGDVCEDAPDCVLAVSPSHWEPANEAPFGAGGVRGVPCIEEVASQLRWVYEHREQARELGRAASQWVLRNRNLDSLAQNVIGAMERYVDPPRPLRRQNLFWVPSWTTPCGISEYSAYLLEHLQGWHVSGDAPDLASTKILHVQHQHAIFDQAGLQKVLRDAKRQQIPVAITEHTVLASRETWELDADVLVALTEQGKQLLQRKWPEKPVVCIPHGCPTWFPKRKARRGKTIGLCGFLEPHKGFWKVLEVLKNVEGSDVFMCSFSKSQDIEREWRRAAKGLPVKRISEFLPAEAVASELAANADILVYWYDEISARSASGAVRIGLASGVPVLTSPVSWFEDLKHVTYQPEDLIEGVRHLLSDTSLQQSLSEKARQFCLANSWARTADMHNKLWQHMATKQLSEEILCTHTRAFM